MMDENTNINESAEIQEVAEPETEDALESAEMQEVADPDTTDNSTEEADGYYEEEPTHEKNDADAAFAEMRREKQALERQLEMAKNALSRYFEGEDVEELSINANAYAEERDPDEYRKEWEKTQDYERALAENEELREAMLEMEVERRMQEGLREVQEINPSVKSLDELGESFAHMIEAGLSTKEAYFAAMQMEGKEKVLAPDAIGRVSDNRAERDYFTSEEIDRLTEEDLADDAVYEKVMRSMERLYGTK